MMNLMYALLSLHQMLNRFKLPILHKKTFT